VSRTFGVGIVGAGTIGKVHAAELADVQAAELVALAEPREEAGRELAGSHGVDWHPDLEGLLARDDVDVVVLCTPSGIHPEGAVAAARAGKHVISEKPMAITLDGVDRMIRACREAGVTLSVIFQYRFNRDALRMKRAHDAGLFGRPVLCNALVHWHRTQDYYDEKGGWRGTWELDGGGALMNQSVHALDLLQWLLGPVESLCAYTETLTHDTFEGTQLTGWYPSRDEELITEEELALFPESVDEEPLGPAHGRQLHAIFEALREGREPSIPGEEARKAVEIILGIYHAARSGERTSLTSRTVPK
jgi:UDP-N-acetyl-2-amino-2-deoxyglucuronate dehydrogenase